MADTALASVLGVAVLYMFYRAVEVQWPESYLPLDRGIEYSITSHPIRYLGFRFLPVFLVGLFVAVSLDRSDVDPVPAVALICLGHIALSNGRALIGLATSPETRRRGPLGLLHVVVAAGILGAGALGYLTRTTFAELIPPVAELSLALWTAALAGVVGAYVITASKTDRSSFTALQRSRASISDELWSRAETEAASVGTDPLLVQAVMVVENANRPRWFRWLERQKGRIAASGTYGIMQVSSPRPLSDEESIAVAVRDRFAGIVLATDGYGMPEWSAVHAFALAYNPDSAFADAVAQTYSDLWTAQNS